MANTISILSYANTFGDLIVNTNELAQEIDNLGKGNYTKDTGLLTLNGSGYGLQVSNNALFSGNVVISGTGTALQVSHDAIFSGNVTILGNTTIGLQEIDFGDIQSNTIHANVATIQTMNVVNDLGVTGNTYITGNLTVTGNTNLTIENVSLDEAVTGNLTVNGTLSGAGVGALLGEALAFSVALG